MSNAAREAFYRSLTFDELVAQCVAKERANRDLRADLERLRCALKESERRREIDRVRM